MAIRDQDDPGHWRRIVLSLLAVAFVPLGVFASEPSPLRCHAIRVSAESGFDAGTVFRKLDACVFGGCPVICAGNHVATPGEVWGQDWVRKMLGPWRLRQLQSARFEIERYGADPGSRHPGMAGTWLAFGATDLEDDSLAYTQVRSILRSNFLKLCRELVEASTPALARIQRDRSDGRRQLRWSPRLGLGMGAHLGLKLRLRFPSSSPSPFPSSNLSLEVRQRLRTGQLSSDLKYEHGEQLIRLSVTRGGSQRGDTIALDLRLRL